VLLGPFLGACEIRGHATGTREIDALSPTHLVPRIDALLLTGGSAFGLDAATGVVAWHEERGLGYETGFARVPIVPAAVIYDLGNKQSARRPDAEMGYAACEAAFEGNTAEGRVGAGTGATVGKILGGERASPGGIGLGRAHALGYTVVAIVVVNAFGDVLDGDGRVLAGPMGDDGRMVSTSDLLLRPDAAELLAWSPHAGTNTTLSAVVTDAPASRIDLARIARQAGSALGRRIAPVNTPFDGDVVFALSTAGTGQELAPIELLALGAAAAVALEAAIDRAVRCSRVCAPDVPE
jgi:L-aminopeptidase/D-esterase-like protein